MPLHACSLSLSQKPLHHQLLQMENPPAEPCWRMTGPSPPTLWVLLPRGACAQSPRTTPAAGSASRGMRGEMEEADITSGFQERTRPVLIAPYQVFASNQSCRKHSFTKIKLLWKFFILVTNSILPSFERKFPFSPSLLLPTNHSFLH